MRPLKSILFILSVLVIQSVVFPRINCLGIFPDLVLVSVIIYGIFEERRPATVFALSISFFQDILAFGPYLNTIAKVIVSNVVSTVKEDFVGDEYSLAALLVVVFTPLIILVSGGVDHFILGKHFSVSHLLFRLIVETIYNLIMVPLLFPLLRWVYLEK